MRFASIDVGSNAVRLLLSQVHEDGPAPVFKKDALFRFPLRLGEDAFLERRISPGKALQLVRVMTAFRNLIDAYAPLDYEACATSAMREAENRDQVIRAVRDASGIDLRVISGRIEAEIITANHSERNFSENGSYLYIDVGGGSTQLTLFSEGRSLASQSFNIGAIRILKKLVEPKMWREMKTWVEKHAAGRDPSFAIGSGGNINKIFMLSGKKPGRPVSAGKLKEIESLLSPYTPQERVRLFALRPDRADVIIPALLIFRRIMKWAGIRKIHVPFIGLSDGLIRRLYEKKSGTQPGHAESDIAENL